MKSKTGNDALQPSRFGDLSGRSAVRHQPLISLIVSLAILNGCGSAPRGGSNATTASAAASAQKRGDWTRAAQLWRQAIEEERGIWRPEYARPTRRSAVYHYELGRSLGVLGQYDDAEKNLLQAFALDEKLNGPKGMDLVELARLNHARGNDRRAASFFDQVLPRLDEIADTNPAAYAALLDEAAAVYEALHQNSRAGELRAKAEKFLARHPNPKFPDDYGWTPYKANPR
jgi:tetratricopeptide (TPR) repeat protein